MRSGHHRTQSRATAQDRSGRLHSLVLSLLVFVCTGAVLSSSAGAFWTAASAPDSAGAGNATRIGVLPAPAATLVGRDGIDVTWQSGALTNGTPVDGYALARYDEAGAPTPVQPDCAGRLQKLRCSERELPDGRWTYAVSGEFAEAWVGEPSPRSVTVLTDTTPPTNDVVLSDGGRTSVKNTDTIYYRSVKPGSFRLRNQLRDAGSGPATSTTGMLAGEASGWSHEPSTVSDPAGGPFDSNLFTWEAGTTAEPSVDVVGTDAYGNTSAPVTLSFRRDDDPPEGGAISYPNESSESESVFISVDPLTDAGSGLGRASRILQRSQAPLTGGECGTFTEFTNHILNPVVLPEVQEDFVRVDNCYRYRYWFEDSVSNEHITTSDSIVKVVARPTYERLVLDTPGLKDYFRLSDTGRDMANLRTPAVNGTYNNSPRQNTPGAIVGDDDTAVTFDGVDQYARTARTVAEDFSIEFWFRSTQDLSVLNRPEPTPTPTPGMLPSTPAPSPTPSIPPSPQWYDGIGLVDGRAGSGGNDFGLSLSADGHVLAGTGTPDSTVTSVRSGLNDDLWHHVVMTREQATGTIVLYIDGGRAGSGTGGTQRLDTFTSLDFGRLLTGNNYFQGSLDEVAVYDRVLTPSQIRGHHHNARR